MKKSLVIALCAVTMLGGCGTYAGQGAHTGAGFGSILGSAIGGITGGPRGSNIGTIVGMAGGAVVGAAVGSAADKAQQKKYEDYKRQYGDTGYGSPEGGGYGSDESGFDPSHRGDDRITFETSPETEHSAIEIRNIAFTDKDGDGALMAGEESRVSFEIMNRSSKPLYDITPLVTEATGNKRIFISPSVRVESIMPHRGVRYTATVMGGRKLKDGTAVLKVGVMQASTEITALAKEINIETRRR